MKPGENPSNARSRSVSLALSCFLPGEDLTGLVAQRLDPLELIGLHAFARQLIGALVLGMTLMAFPPVPVDPLRGCPRLQALPEIDILHRLLVGRFPAALLPLGKPAGDAILEIDAVRIEGHRRRPLERLQRRYGRHPLHAVVGGGGFPAGGFAFAISGSQDGTPATGAGIAAARAVGEDFHAWQGAGVHESSP